VKKTMAIILFSILFVGTAVANTTFSDKVNNFISTEIEEIKTYQKQSWADSKEQLGRTFNQIKGFFIKKEN
jgi:hypothetical protein